MRVAGWAVALGAALGVAALAAGCVLSPQSLPARVEAAGGAPRAAVTAQAEGPGGTADAPDAPAAPAALSAPLSAAELFRRVSPAAAYIDLPGGAGSGVLLEGGYVVTNAHVVWPYDAARVVFGDGSEFVDVPVHNVDLLADLALLGPLETGIAPARLADGEGLGVGAEVYLIGFPGENEHFPQPALARGIISRMRQWETLGISYFQADAAIAGGQSGGMLVSPAGEVIGITGFLFGEGTFALAASAADVEGRIARLMAGEDVDGLPAPGVLGRGTRLGAAYAPAHFYDQRMYVVQGRRGDEVRVRAEGSEDLFLAVTDIAGEYVVLADAGSRTEAGEFTATFDAPYFVFVGPLEEPQAGSEIRLRASQRLLAHTDGDDGRRVRAGETLAGQLDYPGDSDLFRLDLGAGERVRVRVESVLIDPYMTVDSAEARPADQVSDDDSGGGPFGMNAEVSYAAGHSGEFWLIVEDSYGAETGGYLLSVEAM